MTSERFTPYKNNDKVVGFKDNLTGKHHCSIIQARWLLNQFWEQTQRFEKHNTRLTEENIRYEEHIEDLTQENKKLQAINTDHTEYLGDLEADFKRLEQHNKELQERNNRQAKQLDKVYKLMEKQDYKALQNIIQDFKEAEELLKQEWKCFDD